MSMQEHSKNAPVDKMRLDKWLKIARIIKTRSDAAAACDQQRVKVNGAVAKASKLVQVGDQVVVRMKGGQYRTVDILALSQKSLAAAQARELYHEHKIELTPEQEEMLKMYQESARIRLPDAKGRPTKKLRRDLEKFRRQKK